MNKYVITFFEKERECFFEEVTANNEASALMLVMQRRTPAEETEIRFWIKPDRTLQVKMA